MGTFVCLRFRVVPFRGASGDSKTDRTTRPVDLRDPDLLPASASLLSNRRPSPRRTVSLPKHYRVARAVLFAYRLSIRKPFSCVRMAISMRCRIEDMSPPPLNFFPDFAPFPRHICCRSPISVLALHMKHRNRTPPWGVATYLRTPRIPAYRRFITPSPYRWPIMRPYSSEKRWGEARPHRF